VKEPEVFQDKVLTCVDCQQEFTWEAGSQEYFREMGITSEPKRCEECRQAFYLRRATRDARKGAA